MEFLLSIDFQRFIIVKYPATATSDDKVERIARFLSG